jgi:hypothetical protein
LRREGRDDPLTAWLNDDPHWDTVPSSVHRVADWVASSCEFGSGAPGLLHPREVRICRNIRSVVQDLLRRPILGEEGVPWLAWWHVPVQDVLAPRVAREVYEVVSVFCGNTETRRDPSR